MKKFSYTVLFVLVGMMAYCQFSEIPNRFVDPNALFTNWRNDVSLVGTPYLDTTFIDSEFIFQNERFSVPIRYDVVSEAFEARHDGKLLYLNVDFVDTIKIGSACYFFHSFEGKKKVFELLGQSGNKKLLKKHSKIFEQAVTGVPYQDDKPARFETRMPRYYLMSDGNILLEISNFNALYKFYPERKKELKDFIKKEKIERDSDEGLLKLFAIL